MQAYVKVKVNKVLELPALETCGTLTSVHTTFFHIVHGRREAQQDRFPARQSPDLAR
jgi:hypothetical protein